MYFVFNWMQEIMTEIYQHLPFSSSAAVQDSWAEETSKPNKSKRNSSTSQNVDKRLGFLRRETLSYSSSSECGTQH